MLGLDLVPYPTPFPQGLLAILYLVTMILL